MLCLRHSRSFFFLFALLISFTLFGCLSQAPKSSVSEIPSVPLAPKTNITPAPVSVPQNISTPPSPPSIQNTTNLSNGTSIPATVNNGTNQRNATESNATNISAPMGAHQPDLFTSETPIPVPPVFNFTNVTNPQGKLMVYYFYSNSCSACKAIQSEVEALSVKYNMTTEWQFYDLTTVNGTLGYLAYADWKGLNNSQRMIPQVMVNETLITDRFNIHNKLGPLLENFTRGQSFEVSGSRS